MIDTGKVDSAIEGLNESIRPDPTMAVSHFRLAMAYEVKDISDEAKAEQECGEQMMKKTGNLFPELIRP